MPNIIFTFSMFITMMMGGCKEKGVEPPTVIKENTWERVEELTNVDIRYMITFNNELYLSVINYQGDSLYKGAILKTSDGFNWNFIKGFPEYTGSMTVKNDSLYLLTDHFVYKMVSNSNWEIKYFVPVEISRSGDNGEIIFINDTLYVCQVATVGLLFGLFPDGTYDHYPFSNITLSPYISNFKKVIKENMPLIYARSKIGHGEVRRFDGRKFYDLGMSSNNTITGALNALEVSGDTLFVGVWHTPSSNKGGYIKYLSQNNWYLYGDTLPLSSSANDFEPQMKTHPTCIKMVNNKLIIGTDVVGVCIWSQENGWKKINKGLPTENNTLESKEIYQTIIFLEYLNGFIFVGYGNPGFANGWVKSNYGLFKYTLQ